MAAFRVEGMRVTFHLKVKPRSSRDRLRVDQAGHLHLDLRAAPVDGEANAALIRFLAKRLRLPQDSIAIAVGSKGRDKVIRVEGYPPFEITDRVMAAAHQN